MKIEFSELKLKKDEKKGKRWIKSITLYFYDLIVKNMNFIRNTD